MEREVRYCTTTDGVSIAYAVSGVGAPLVWATDMPFAHLQYDPGLLRNRDFRLVLYDPRGMGLSERNVERFGIEEWLMDLEAVVDSVGLDRFALQGTTGGGPVAIAYAARHPERVSHLILTNTGARPADGYRTEQSQLLAQMMTRDWEMYSENAGAIAFGWGREQGREFGEFIRAAVTPQTARKVFGTLRRVDVTDILRQVQAPTLVLFNSGLTYVTVEMSRKLAAGIPDARLVVKEGKLGPMTFQEEIVKFVGASGAAAGKDEGGLKAESSMRAGTAVILFTDIADSTALTERLGDAAFRAKARELDTSLRALIRENSGVCIDAKTLGDGVLATFASAAQAIEAALACGSSGEAAGLPLHLGLHAGDVIREENNVFGGAVNIAARISGLSAPGEVLVSDTVRSLARTSAGVTFEDRGEQALKGVGEPVRVFAVREA